MIVSIAQKKSHFICSSVKSTQPRLLFQNKFDRVS